MRGLFLVAASGGHSSSRCTGLLLSRPLLLRSTGSRRAGSVVVAHGPSCPAACGIFPDQGLNPCPLHWQADSQPLRHQGSPAATLRNIFNRESLLGPMGEALPLCSRMGDGFWVEVKGVQSFLIHNPGCFDHFQGLNPAETLTLTEP